MAASNHLLIFCWTQGWVPFCSEERRQFPTKQARVQTLAGRRKWRAPSWAWLLGIGDILRDNANQGESNARQLPPSDPPEAKATLQVCRLLATGSLQEVSCVFAQEVSAQNKCTKLPLVNVSWEQMQGLIKSAPCDLVQTKRHLLACDMLPTFLALPVIH